MRFVPFLAATAVVLGAVHAQSEDASNSQDIDSLATLDNLEDVVGPTVNELVGSKGLTTDDGTYSLENVKGPTVNEDNGGVQGASTNIKESMRKGTAPDVGGHGNVVSGGQTNSLGSYNGYGNLNHDINSSYNGNTIINNYASSPRVVCIGDWCTEDPPCEDATKCKHQRVVYQDGIYQTEASTDDAWDRLVRCEGSRCHYNRCNDEECEQKIVCSGGQCAREDCQDDECLRKLVCKEGLCQHEPCEGNECGNRYNFENGEYRACPTCKGAKCPRPQMPGTDLLSRVQADLQREAQGRHVQQILMVYMSTSD